jgi:hypothetical protein
MLIETLIKMAVQSEVMKAFGYCKSHNGKKTDLNQMEDLLDKMVEIPEVFTLI